MIKTNDSLKVNKNINLVKKDKKGNKKKVEIKNIITLLY